MKTTILMTILLATTAAMAAEPKKPAPATTQPTFTSAAEVVKVVPDDMYPKTAAGWTDLKIEAINDVLTQKVKDHQGTFAAEVYTVKVTKENPPDKRLTLWPVKTNMGKVPVIYYYHFDDKWKTQLAALNKGDKITVTGTIVWPRFQRNGTEVLLAFDLEKCEIVKPTK